MSPITGERHKCTTCTDFDFCSSCYQKEARIHDGHKFRLIELSKATVGFLEDIKDVSGKSASQ
ncbi:hypothetical protein BC936DRAFT_147934 [Jimgerdemannia flammicorona]|uniref:ZZ-type domain-containing protein n=1 Tax=Jimgerdemannia flammicorona TaxID=994334 RepID=A0A433DNM0_9FUNG|nr:hypothetical protein BC936DRAFT_147934 [Jimgerdemannia flammicorona]